MRLIAHNIPCNVKGCGSKLRKRLRKKSISTLMFSKIDWKALVDGARSMGYIDLPDDAPDTAALYALLELHLEEGSLVCPETGRKFSVTKGIPNMLLHEDEV